MAFRFVYIIRAIVPYHLSTQRTYMGYCFTDKETGLFEVSISLNKSLHDIHSSTGISCYNLLYDNL